MTSLQERGEKKPRLPYSKSLIGALKFGEEEARKLNHAYLQSESFFLGLMRDEDVLETLKQLKIDSERINISRRIVDEFIAFAYPSSHGMDPKRTISPTPHLEKILELANIEANQANAREINPIHALIGTILVKQRSFIHIGEVLFQMEITEENIPDLREKAKELDLRCAGLL